MDYLHCQNINLALPEPEYRKSRFGTQMYQAKLLHRSTLFVRNRASRKAKIYILLITSHKRLGKAVRSQVGDYMPCSKHGGQIPKIRNK